MQSTKKNHLLTADRNSPYVISVSCSRAVANAFAIMGIVMAIFAVLACDFYGKRDFYNFGTFTRAYFSMFQAAVPLFI